MREMFKKNKGHKIIIDESVANKDAIYKILNEYANDNKVSIFQVGDTGEEVVKKLTEEKEKYVTRIKDLVKKEGEFNRQCTALNVNNSALKERDITLSREIEDLLEKNKELEEELNYRVMNDTRASWLDL